MTNTEPQVIRSIRQCLDEARIADIRTCSLERGREWAIRNDPALLVDIEDALDFRNS